MIKADPWYFSFTGHPIIKPTCLQTALTGPGQQPALSTVMFPRIGSHVGRRTPLSLDHSHTSLAEPMASRRLATAGKSRKKSRRHPGGEYDGSPRQKKKGKNKSDAKLVGGGSEKNMAFPPPLA